MGASRFFAGGIYEEGATVVLERADAHKILRVLRLHSGDTIRIVDSSGSEFEAVIVADTEPVQARLESRIARDDTRSSVRLTLAQGVPKGQKMEFVVEKASELGVASIVPFTSERTVVRDCSPAKVDRWRRIAKSSAEQSGRREILQVSDPVPFLELPSQFAAYDAVLFPWEAADPVPLRDALAPLLQGVRSVLAVIGPEGGFSHDEAAAAQAAGAAVVSLGRRILRTETAGLYIASIVDFLTAS